jgi:transposase InsO family protein
LYLNTGSRRLAAAVRVLLSFAIALLHSLRDCFRSQSEQALVELALRQQLAVLAHAGRRPRLTSLDRAFWVLLRQPWPRWREALVVVQPETVVRWHRKGFRLYWRLRSRQRPGRPRIPKEVRELIRRMAVENRWGARKIHAELAKLGIEVSLATVSRYLPKRPPDPGQRQNWLTFLRNHKDALAAMDFFVVPTVRFQLLYVWFVLDHDRRRVIHFNVTTNPTASWVIQQLRVAFPSDNALAFLLYDRDSIFSAEVTATIRNLGIEPVRTAYRSPWQNPLAERWVGTCRRELLDHVVVLGERHLRRLLAEYTDYYNVERVHTALGDSPDGRPSEGRPSSTARVVAFPRVGGLHHRYAWCNAV